MKCYLNAILRQSLEENPAVSLPLLEEEGRLPSRPTTVQWGIHYWNLPTRVGGAYLVDNGDEHVERRETNSYIINSALTSYFRFWEYTWLGKGILNTGTANRGKKN